MSDPRNAQPQAEKPVANAVKLNRIVTSSKVKVVPLGATKPPAPAQPGKAVTDPGLAENGPVVSPAGLNVPRLGLIAMGLARVIALLIALPQAGSGEAERDTAAVPDAPAAEPPAARPPAPDAAATPTNITHVSASLAPLAHSLRPVPRPARAAVVAPRHTAPEPVQPRNAAPAPGDTPTDYIAQITSGTLAALRGTDAGTTGAAEAETLTGTITGVVRDALAQGQSKEQIDKLLNEAVQSRSITLPDSLIRPDGSVDTGAILSGLIRP